MAWCSNGFGAIDVAPPALVAPGIWAAGFAVTGGPVLDGHYPFEPVVPGAALLDATLALLAIGYGVTARRIADFKLLRPIRPGERGTIVLRPLDGPAAAWAVDISAEGALAARMRLATEPTEVAPDSELAPVCTELDISALPHAAPMLLLDRASRCGDTIVVAEWRPASSALAALVPGWGHCEAAVPIALALESFLQAGALLFEPERLRASTVLLGSVRTVTVAAAPSAAPLRHRVMLGRRVGDTALFAGVTEQDGVVLLRCDGVTAALKPRPVPQSAAVGCEITFHKEKTT